MINGSTEDQLAELARFGTPMSALIDSERLDADSPLEEPRRSFVEACSKQSIECKVLDRRATENYLTDRAVKQVKGEKYRALGPYERLADAPMPWAKTENWRIADAMDLDDFRDNDLGKFLAGLLPPVA